MELSGNEGDCALGNHRGGAEKETNSGKGEVVVSLAQAVGFISVVTGKGLGVGVGDSSLRPCWLLMDC